MAGIDTGTLAVGAPLLLVMIVVMLVGIPLLVRARKWPASRSPAARWPHTLGTVQSSTVQVSFGATSRRESPLVLYAYQVEGRMFQGRRVRASDKYGRTMPDGAGCSASATVARYPAGTSVTVYYDPLNPANSALEP
jgi:hypothetical protein